MLQSSVPMSYEEEDTLSYEEEDTLSYEEEDTFLCNVAMLQSSVPRTAFQSTLPLFFDENRPAGYSGEARLRPAN
jgi:hypothetical protein